MDSYSRLAGCYDIFMDDVPYERWYEFILSRFEKYGLPGKIVLDLGCGTGIMTEMLADAGYDMIGVDLSSDMLDVALEKKNRSGHDILYLMQDMREFELYGTVGAVVSVCDSINYILEDGEMIKVFKLVNNYLDPKGLFIFDFNTVRRYEGYGDSTIAENRDDYSFIWDNFYHEEGHINEYDLTIFAREGELYRKSCETHLQRGYTLDEIKGFLEAAKLVLLESEDADTGGEPDADSQRIHIVAMESGKVR